MRTDTHTHMAHNKHTAVVTQLHSHNRPLLIECAHACFWLSVAHKLQQFIYCIQITRGVCARAPRARSPIADSGAATTRSQQMDIQYEREHTHAHMPAVWWWWWWHGVRLRCGRARLGARLAFGSHQSRVCASRWSPPGQLRPPLVGRSCAKRSCTPARNSCTNTLSVHTRVYWVAYAKQFCAGLHSCVFVIYATQ